MKEWFDFLRFRLAARIYPPLLKGLCLTVIALAEQEEEIEKLRGENKKQFEELWNTATLCLNRSGGNR